jgi:uncharacterized protein
VVETLETEVAVSIKPIKDVIILSSPGCGGGGVFGGVPLVVDLAEGFGGGFGGGGFSGGGSSGGW